MALFDGKCDEFRNKQQSNQHNGFEISERITIKVKLASKDLG